MTDKEVDELEAGKQANIAVLCEVFKFPYKKIFYNSYDTEQQFPYYIPSGKPRRTHMIDAVPVPPFSELISAAWEVLERLDGIVGGVRLETVNFVRHGCFVSFAVPSNVALGVRQFVITEAETFPLAICRAALKAINTEDSTNV